MLPPNRVISLNAQVFHQNHFQLTSQLSTLSPYTMSAPPLPFLARTLVSWTGEQDGDLGFLENEVVKVFHLVDELWWQGSLARNGAEGIFPRDFVEILPNTNILSGSGTPVQERPSPPKTGGMPSHKTPMATPKGTPTKNTPKLTPTMSLSKLTPNMSLSKVTSSKLAASRATVALALSPTVNYTGSANYSSSGNHAAASSPDPYQGRALYSQYVLGAGFSNSDTALVSHSPTPKSRRERAPPLAAPQDDLMQSIATKKLQLEKELHQLRQLERHATLADLGYVSEDLLLSKRNLEHQLTDEELEEAPPPPPPKHGMREQREMRDPRELMRDPRELMRDPRELAHELGRDQPGRSTDPFRYPELKASLKSLQSDVLNLSELSATSAGSFMRHKYDAAYDDEPEDRRPRLLKMLRKKGPENLLELRLGAGSDDWRAVKTALNRANTLSTHDKQTRTRRVARLEPNFIVKPLEYISAINVSETFGPEPVLPDRVLDVNMRKVAEFLAKYAPTADFNDVISDVSVKFGASRPDMVRALLLHLCKFNIIDEPESILLAKPNLHEVMAKGEATVFQLNYLFKKLLEALRIPAEVVVGFWKKPNEFYHSDQFVVNHCWLSVMLETSGRLSSALLSSGVFRIVDLLCFQNGSVCNIAGLNEFYFLCEPVHLVSTHLPSVAELQHVCPPVDVNAAFHLPRLYSGFAKAGIRFSNFNNALTRLADLEVFEADVYVPDNVELFTLIKSARTTSNDYTLCQHYWSGSLRMARIKAMLPAGESIGVLQIFAGPKGLQTHFDNIHELACVIPLYHEGTSHAARFVPRFPTIQAQNNDLYIRHPQMSTLAAKNSYNFEIDIHPSLALTDEAALLNKDFKIVIESPSGKYTKLVRDDPQNPISTFHSTIPCLEPGLYRALVIGDSGNSWYVFAQWECS